MGRTSKKKKRASSGPKDTLSAELQNRLYEWAEKGHQQALAGNHQDAIDIWKQAVQWIPEPKHRYTSTADFYGAIAFQYQMMGLFPQALDWMKKSMDCWGAEASHNPFTLLHLGELYYELGEMEYSVDCLRRAYVLEGDELFEPDVYGKIDHRKYLEIVKHVLHGEGEESIP